MVTKNASHEELSCDSVPWLRIGLELVLLCGTWSAISQSD